MTTNKPVIFIAGHRGMVGSAIARQLQAQGDAELLTASRNELDLLNQQAVNAFFQQHQIDQVIIAAAKVGGIEANNSLPAEFIYQNLMIEANLIHAAHQADVQQLLFLGSSCIYPREAPQPMAEDALLTGPLEPTNEPYAIAKIAGIKLCESYNRQYGRDYRSVMPTNLYGPGDNFHPEHSHVIPALLRRLHEATQRQAPEVVIWGSGTPKREFLHVDDMAAACLHVLKMDFDTYRANTQPTCSHINVGTGVDVTIRALAETIAGVTGYQGALRDARRAPLEADPCPRFTVTNMRLSQQHIDSIKQTARAVLGDGARVILFGSRVDDAKKGGDIDLLFETDHPVSNRATAIGAIYASLIRQLGDRKIDILLKDSATPQAPVLDMARQTGILL